MLEWEDFSTCWPNDQLKAQGLVARIRDVRNVKDSFTQMKQEREAERYQRQAEERTKREAAKQHRNELAAIEKDLSALFALSNPQQRGKALENVLNRLFAISNIHIRDAFTLIGPKGEGIIEQIDGLVELDGRLYLVEMKWWKDRIGPGEVSQHLVRLYGRADAYGIFISASGYTDAAINICRDALRDKIIILCELREFVLLLEQQKDLTEFLRAKIQAAIIDKNPLYSSF